jgi:hypothetical protein
MAEESTLVEPERRPGTVQRKKARGRKAREAHAERKEDEDRRNAVATFDAPAPHAALPFPSTVLHRPSALPLLRKSGQHLVRAFLLADPCYH